MVNQRKDSNDMVKATTRAAEAKFAATRKKTAGPMSEREKAEREVASRTAKLRALRLARDAADKQAADEKAAANPKKKPKAKKAEPADKPAKRKTRVY